MEERGGRGRLLEPESLGQVDLVDVARRDVLERALHDA